MNNTEHTKSIHHIRRLIGQLQALEKTIESDASCTEISTEMYSILQSMKGLSERMFINSLQNDIVNKPFDDHKKKKLEKIMRLLS